MLIFLTINNLIYFYRFHEDGDVASTIQSVIERDFSHTLYYTDF